MEADDFDQLLVHFIPVLFVESMRGQLNLMSELSWMLMILGHDDYL